MAALLLSGYLQFDNPALQPYRDGMGSVIGAKLGEDARHVPLDRLLCDRKLSPDLLVRIPSRDQPENLHLALLQAAFAGVLS